MGIADLEEMIVELTIALDEGKRWHKMVVGQRDRAWNELDALQGLQKGTTQRREIMAQEDLFDPSPDE